MIFIGVVCDLFTTRSRIDIERETCVMKSAVTNIDPHVRQASLQIQVFRVWHIHSFNNKLSSSNRKH